MANNTYEIKHTRLGFLELKHIFLRHDFNLALNHKAMNLLGFLAMALATTKQPLFVVFGRPGSGKSTVADAAANLLRNEGTNILRLDLDVCVPDWMKDNFANGIYPTLKEREIFAIDACDYVSRELENASIDVSVVSFSFVNDDLRAIFRRRFPNSIWLLIDTDENEANNRVMQRTGHFYKGKSPKAEPSDKPRQHLKIDNNDWNFSPITFEHEIVDGLLPVDHNARVVADFVKKNLH